MRVRIAMLTLAALVFSACGGGAGGGGGGASSGGGGDAPSGAVATGLQTATDGWSFPNFPSSAYADVNFDETDLVSMFGSDETICVGGVATPCKLTAEAAAWARMVNQARASGHCEGLVALASSRFNNKETPATVKLPSQQETLHAIMRTFATQFLPEVQESIGKWMAASFEDKIDEMKKSFAAGTLQYTLGVYTAGGGHALLPYAIEYPTPDTPRVMLYDSNWPGKNRYVDIDLKAKTWRFSFSGEDPANDPDAWTGGPQDMDLTPLDARQGTCPFCGKDVKVAKTTMLIRSANLDWSVETDGGVVSPANPTGTDGTTVKAVKGGSFDFLAPGIVTRSSYDYLVSVPDYPEDASTTTSAVKKKKKRKSKLKFSGATSVYAVMPEGIAQFTTPGSEDDPVEVEGSSISTTDPGVDLTLASGNLVANASGSAVSLSVEGETMAVAVTAANGQVIKQEVSADQPTVQMKADPEGGGITVLAASATGVVEKTEVSSTGETTKSVVTEALNLSEVKAELPPALASKENPALPSLATRDMANPDYKVDAAYSAPTTIPAKGGDQVAEAVQTTQAKASNAATPNEPTPTQPVRNAALPTTLPPKGAAPVDDDAPPTTVKRTVAAATSGTGSAAAVALKPSLGRFTIPSVTFGDAAFTIDEPSSNSSGGWRFTSSKPDVVEVSALTGRATIKGAGSTTITATQSAVKGFEQASITALLIVARDTPVLGAYTTASRTFGDESFVLKNPTSNSPGAFTVESSDESVAKFSKTSGRLVISGAGRTTITATQAATDDYLSAVKSFVLTVKKGTPELGAFDDVARTFGDAGFTLAKPTSDSRAAITLSSSNPAVATVDGASGAVSIVGAGTTTFTAAQAANDDFVAASKSMTFTVRQAIPALGSMTGATKTFGDASFSLTKPSSPSSGAFSFASSNTGVASVDADGKVTVVGAGTATITATQAASGNYSSSSVAAVVTVGRAATTIANLSLNNMTFGVSDVTLAPRSNNPSPFTFSSSAPTVLAVNATTGRVTVVGAGTATITVRQASSANYEAGSESLTVQIGRATPTLSSFSAISKDYGDAPFTLTPPESDSPAPFTYESSNPSVASIDASTGVVTIRNVTTVGSPVTLTVRQAQTDNYAAIAATTTLIIGRGTPVFGDFAITSKVWGSSNFAVTAPTSTSAGAFTYNIVDVDGVNEAAIATITSAGTIAVVGPGSVQVRATQAANLLYVSSSITATFTITSATPSFGSFVAPAKTFGDAQFTMAPPSSLSSGAFSFTSSDTNVATINASTGVVVIVGAGSTTITAAQVAASPYTARSATSVLTVAKATAALSGFGGMASGLAGTRYVNYYADNVNWFATATRHGQTLTSTSIQNFTSSADNYSWQWLGTFRASIGGSYNFCTASDDASHLWLGAAATSGFTTANAVVNNGGAHGVVTRCGNITLSAGAEYPIRIQFGEAGGGDVMNVYFTPPGGSATYNGTGYYYTGGGLTKTLGDLPFTPTLPSSASTGAITYSSSNPSVATIDSTTGLITLQSGGTTTITAEQAATDNYNASTTTTSLTVLRDPLLNSFTIPAKTYGAAAFNLTAPATSSDGAFTYTSSNTSVATVNSTTGAVTVVGIGSTTITASQLATSVYAAGTITATLTVEATTATSISAGQYFTCMRTTTGAAQCFGQNNYGQLGDNTNTDRTTAVGVVGLSSGVASVSSGAWHSCAVTDSGSVKCWGRNDWGNLGNGTTNTSYTPVDVSGLNATAVKVVTTNYSSCALTSVGGVKCWGYGGWGLIGDGTGSSRYTPVDVSGMTSGVIALAAGGQHMCAVKNTGALFCWGWNGYGQLGDGTGSERWVPTEVNGLDSGVIAVAPGMYHTCASLATGAVKCWGYNGDGQLGNNNWSQSTVPVSVFGMSDATTSISSGERYTCVVKNTGALWCWGSNVNGQFGNGNTSTTNYPVNISGLGTSVRAVSAALAGFHTCALTTDGTAKCWGYNSQGQLGDTSTTNRVSPTNIGGIVAPQIGVTTLSGFALPGSGYTASSPGFTLAPPTSSREGAFTFASTNPNSATINATTGEVTILGGGSTLLTATQAATSTHDVATAYVSLAFAPVISRLSLSYYSVCGVTTAGGMKCWGNNSWGQIGSSASNPQTTPTNVPGYTSGVAAVTNGHHHSCALQTTGAVNCWGLNWNNNLYPGISQGATAIAAGYLHTCALMAYGGVKCWGRNDSAGQLGDGANTNRVEAVDVVGLSSGVVAITAGWEHNCALLNTGAVKCWGYNGYGQLGDGTNSNRSTPVQVSGLTSGVVSISAGNNHTCAHLDTGAVRCWGYNGYGQVGDATTSTRYVPTQVSTLTTGVQSLSVGWEHSCAVLTSGAAKCWGRNSEGEVGDGTYTNRSTPVAVVGLSSGVTSIEANQSLSTCALVTGNNVKCWGHNGHGQLGDGTTTNRTSPVDITSLNSGSETTTTLGALTLPSSRYTVGSADFTLDPPSSSRSGTITFSSSNTEVATVNATTGLVHIEGLGTAVLAANIGGTGQYKGATSTVTLTVNTACAAGGLCSIGDTGPGGGKVFYDAGSNQQWGRYLEAAPGDLSSAMAWCNDTSSVIGASGSAVGTGIANTVAMDTACTSGAGQSAADYTNNGYSDWYLPSLNELTEMFDRRVAVGGFTTASYWSSSEENGEFAKRLGFPDGGISGHVKSQGFRVRPIRAFAPLTDCQLGLSCEVGDIGPAGGRIIYVNPNESNEYDYVEAAPSDVAPAVWCSGSKAATLIGGTDSWRRLADAAQSHSVIQRRNCTTGGGLDAHNYSANGLTGWGVPNIGLVQLMRTSLYANNVGDFTAAQYMTSNEQDQNTAISVDMADGTLAYPAKTVATRVRPVRFFAKTDRRKFTPTLSGISVPSNSMAYGAADFNVSTSSTGLNEMGGSFTSFGTINYTSSNTSVATIEGNTGRVSIVGSGSFTITATQTAWGVFKAPVAVTNTISVSNGTPQFSGLALPGSSYRADDAPFTVTAATSSNSPGAVTYSSSNTSAATINSASGLVTIVGAGTTTITATLAASGFWNGASLTVSLSIGALCADGGECRIGDVGPGGGKIFLLPSSTGNTTGKFFEAAAADLSSSMAWCDNQSLAGANGYAIGTGEANTVAIDAICTSGAGQSAADYTNNGYGDWYLPSHDEFTAMLAVRTTIGGFATASYWSSSEEDWAHAKRFGVPDGAMSGHNKLQYFQVRPIRSFEIKRSCLDIKNSTGTNTNGVYTIALNVGGAVMNTQVYCLMDSAMDGGGWTMAMKAPRNSQTFPYSSNYWTTANTLNVGNAGSVTADATNAKFDTFNYISATSMLAVYPDAGINGGSITGHTYGWTWKQVIPNGPKTPLQIFSDPTEQFISDAYLYSGFDTRVWTRQRDIRFYGFNWNDNHKARWGFGWNENGGGLFPNGARGSDDASGGIGLAWNNYSAGDGSFCCTESNGLNRSMAFEMYVR